MIFMIVVALDVQQTLLLLKQKLSPCTHTHTPLCYHIYMLDMQCKEFSKLVLDSRTYTYLPGEPLNFPHRHGL